MIMSSCLLVEISYKPPDVSFMGRTLKMRKYGVYFPSDGEVVYIYPDDEDVVFLTWLANTLLLGSVYLEVFVYEAIYYINLYP